MDNKYFLGLSVGQGQDSTALAVLEAQEETIFHCRHLKRWPLRASYPEIVEETRAIVADEKLQTGARTFDSRTQRGYLHQITEARSLMTPVLAIDATGVGRPVVDLFEKRFGGRQSLGVYLPGSYGYSVFESQPAPRPAPLPEKQGKCRVRLMPIQITGGYQVTSENGVWGVPKRDLISSAQVALQSGKLKVAASLPEAGALTAELERFRVKVNLNEDAVTEWRERPQDDLVLALCVALWVAENRPKAGRFFSW